MMVTPLNQKNYHAESACYCVKCGSDIKDSQGAFWVRLVTLHDGYGAYILHPESVLGNSEDLGFWRLCPGCEPLVNTRYSPGWAVRTLDSVAVDSPVFFYEREFYVLSNFSAFELEWKGIIFPTSEHAYHFEKFSGENCEDIRLRLVASKSAHDAQKLAKENRGLWRSDWDDVKVGVMKQILTLKVAQHPYVLKKLMETGDREIIEDSWRDDYWGWGPKKDGLNKLGKLWMEIREELRKTQ